MCNVGFEGFDLKKKREKERERERNAGIEGRREGAKGNAPRQRTGTNAMLPFE